MPDQASWLDDPKTYPAWECAGELGLSICLQMSSKAFPQMIKMAERFPKVRIILDHMARPALEDGPPYAAANSLFELARYPNVYLKLTPRSFIESRKGKASPETFFPRLVSAFGSSRLAWGSNYLPPRARFPSCSRSATSALASLSQNDRDSIFAKTAQTLYPVLAK